MKPKPLQQTFRSPQLALAILISLTLVAFGLRLHRLERASLWYDELLQLDIAQGSLRQIRPRLERHAAMPLDYFIAFAWIKLGHQETWVRFPALAFGTLAIPLVYALGARCLTKRAGLIAASLLTWASFAVRYSQEARPYALLTAFTMIGYFGLWQAYQTGRQRYWGVAIVGFAGALLSHYFALFLLLPVGLFVLFQQLYHLKEQAVWQHTTYFSLLIIISLSLLVLRGRPDMVYSVGKRFAQDLSRPARLTLPAEEKPNLGSGPPLEIAFFQDKILGPLTTTEGGSLLLYNALFIVALLSLLKKRNRQRAGTLLLLAWTLLPTILVYLFLLARGTFYASRYILYTLPPYLLLVAYGIELIVAYVETNLSGRSYLAASPPLSKIVPGKDFRASTRSLSLMALFGLLLLPLLIAEQHDLANYYATPSYEDWRAAGQIIASNAGANDAVIAVKAEPAMNWYYPAATTPFNTYSHSDPIWEAMAAHPRRWFVLSSYSFKRDEGLRNWLKEQGTVMIAIDRRVSLYFHQEGLSRPGHLALVQSFTLPPYALTYAGLGDQFYDIGQRDEAQTYYQRAMTLSQTEEERLEYEARLAKLKKTSSQRFFSNRAAQSRGSKK